MSHLSKAARRTKVSKLEKLNVDLKEEYDLLFAEKVSLMFEHAFLKSRLTEYVHCLKKNSRKSSEPTADGLGNKDG